MCTEFCPCLVNDTTLQTWSDYGQDYFTKYNRSLKGEESACDAAYGKSGACKVLEFVKEGEKTIKFDPVTLKNVTITADANNTFTTYEQCYNNALKKDSKEFEKKEAALAKTGTAEEKAEA